MSYFDYYLQFDSATACKRCLYADDGSQVYKDALYIEIGPWIDRDGFYVNVRSPHEIVWPSIATIKIPETPWRQFTDADVKENDLPAIDITLMQGMKPLVEEFLLPNTNAALAIDCTFDSGVISPIFADLQETITFPEKPKTIFHYRDDFWFSWGKDVDAIRSPVAQDAYGRVYYCDGEYPKVTAADIATSGSVMPTAYYRLGIPAPDSAVMIGAVTPPSGTTDDSTTDDETRYYVQTFVSATGEEGPPSDASTEVTIAIPDSSVALTFLPAQSNNNNLTKRRLYRSETSTSSSGWYQVAELDIAVSSYTDSKKSDELGAELATETYLPPPDDMMGLCLMANGIAAGFSGNTVLFSEAYLPYAWPEENQLTTEDDVVAICPIETAVVVGTTGYPYLMSGVSPSSITSQKINVQQACISKKSMVSVDGIVMYASPDGIVAVSVSDGAILATEQILTRTQWQAMKPATLRAWAYEGKYIGLTDTTAFIFDPKNACIINMTNTWDAAYNDMTADALFVAKGTRLYSWKGDESTPLNFTWRSKKFVSGCWVSFNSCKVIAADVSVISLKVIVDDVELITIPKGSIPETAFRLPVIRGYKWQVEISGNSKVERITMASSMQELSGGQ